jgi:hypothetical protein
VWEDLQIEFDFNNAMHHGTIIKVAARACKWPTVRVRKGMHESAKMRSSKENIG